METNLIFMGKIPAPQEIKAQYPLSEEAAEVKNQRDQIVRGIIAGSDDRLMLVIGPCSADREDAVMAYLEKLRPLQDKVKDRIFIVPRLYTNKPRTTGAGYKGMLHSPDPGAQPNMIKGVIAIRKLHLRALTDYGFSCADFTRCEPREACIYQSAVGDSDDGMLFGAVFMCMRKHIINRRKHSRCSCGNALNIACLFFASREKTSALIERKTRKSTVIPFDESVKNHCFSEAQ